MDIKVESHRWWIEHGQFIEPRLSEEQGSAVFSHFHEQMAEVEKEKDETLTRYEDEQNEKTEQLKSRLDEIIGELDAFKDRL